MFKSLIYKEWIKTRWFVLLYLIIGIATVAYIFLNVQHDIKFSGGKNYWNRVLFQSYNFFIKLKYVPVLGGLMIGLTQYFPEITNKRLKLTFHLPVNENTSLLQMMLYGVSCLTVIYGIMLTLFLFLSHLFFAWQISSASLITLLPWFLAGYATYFLVSVILLEPIWKYRALYLLVSFYYLSFYFKSTVIGAYSPTNITLIIMTSMLSIALLFTGFRFRKGEE